LTKKHVKVSLNAELIERLDPTGSNVAAQVEEAVALDLILRDEISSGKAAELLNVSKDRIRELLWQRGVPYFRQTIEEVLRDVETARALAKDRTD
jgi:predicted HTH domain antitoxin